MGWSKSSFEFFHNILWIELFWPTQYINGMMPKSSYPSTAQRYRLFSHNPTPSLLSQTFLGGGKPSTWSPWGSDVASPSTGIWEALLHWRHSIHLNRQNFYPWVICRRNYTSGDIANFKRFWKRKCQSLSCVHISSTPWTVACHAPLLLKFSREEYWSGLGCQFLLQGIFPTEGLNLGLLHCRQILYHLSQ